MKSSRAQTELMGLVIIFILLALGMLFFLQFAVLKEPPQNTFTQKQMTDNFVNALMLTQTDCENRDMTSLIQKCHTTSLLQPVCPGDPRKTHCEYAEELIEQMLNETLKKWNKQYELTTKGEFDQNPKIQVESNKPCLRGKESTSYFISNPLVIVTLDVCK